MNYQQLIDEEAGAREDGVERRKRLQTHGKPAGRLDAQAKSRGRQSFGIDACAEGMKTVLIVPPPVFGAQLAGCDASKTKAIKGGAGVLPAQLDRGASGRAVVADGCWPAKMGRDALLA